MVAKRSPKTRISRCPVCRASTRWEGNSYRPFCSERCRWLDLGAWIQGRYIVPGEAVGSSKQEQGTGTLSDSDS
ncbi:MAG: DNA gyrase inhibitor YacG [Deltaproteobacteria bacterium]|nr:DNA gyrase inhibitor YacG [Deltaproteobacteria bacterium]